MGRINVAEYSVAEKFQWLETAVGDYKSLQVVGEFLDCQGAALEALLEYAVDGETLPTDDVLAWWLEGSLAYDAVEIWMDLGYDVEHAVDTCLHRYGLDYDDSADGFDTQHDWYKWKNGA